MNEKEKAELGAKTFEGFCRQFGEDVYSHLLLEELFEGLIHAETLFVFGEPQQTGDQIDYSPPGDRDGELRPEGSVPVSPTSDLGQTDRPPYP